MTDIEIAQASQMLPIEEVAAKVGIKPSRTTATTRPRSTSTP